MLARPGATTYRIRAAFHRLEIPLGVACGLFFTWRSDCARGCSQSFLPNAPIYDGHEDALEYRRYAKGASAFLFRLHGRPLLGDPFALAQAPLRVPDRVFAGAPGAAAFPLATRAGPFVLTVAFELLPEEARDAAPERELLDAGAYAALAEGLPPVLYGAAGAAPFWGAAGLPGRLAAAARCQAEGGALLRLVECEDALRATARRSALYAALFRTAILRLTAEPPRCWSAAAGAADLDEARDLGRALLPALAVEVAQGIDRFVDEGPTTDLLERCLVDVCALLVGLLKRTRVRDVWLVHTLAVMYFVSAYIEARYRGAMPNIVDSLAVIARQVLVVFLGQWAAAARQAVASPARLRGVWERNRKLFATFSIPTAVWDEASKYMLALTDCYAANAWLFESDSLDVDAARFVDAMPMYGWPVIVGIEFLVRYADDIVSGRLPLKKVPREMQHGWISLVLNKMNDVFARGYNEKKLALVVGDAASVPAIPSVEKFIDLNPVFASARMEIPPELPSLSPP
jgi:hypothetical protein